MPTTMDNLRKQNPKKENDTKQKEEGPDQGVHGMGDLVQHRVQSLDEPHNPGCAKDFQHAHHPHKTNESQAAAALSPVVFLLHGNVVERYFKQRHSHNYTVK